MRFILTIFFVFSLHAMEEDKALTNFHDLPLELRTKVVMHLFDHVLSAHSSFFLSEILAVLKTCKRYYLQDIQFTGELLKLIHKKCYYENFVEMGLNLPTPACKRFLHAYHDKDKEQCFGQLRLLKMSQSQLRIFRDVQIDNICFKESTSNNSTSQLQTQ